MSQEMMRTELQGFSTEALQDLLQARQTRLNKAVTVADTQEKWYKHHMDFVSVARAILEEKNIVTKPIWQQILADHQKCMYELVGDETMVWIDKEYGETTYVIVVSRPSSTLTIAGQSIEQIGSLIEKYTVNQHSGWSQPSR